MRSLVSEAPLQVINFWTGPRSTLPGQEKSLPPLAVKQFLGTIETEAPAVAANGAKQVCLRQLESFDQSPDQKPPPVCTKGEEGVDTDMAGPFTWAPRS